MSCLFERDKRHSNSALAYIIKLYIHNVFVGGVKYLEYYCFIICFLRCIPFEYTMRKESDEIHYYARLL